MAPRLDLKNLSKTFPGVRALDDVSMSVEPGEIRALLGENGAGKSTLGKIVAGVYSRSRGTVIVDGTELGDFDEKAAGDMGIGIVHQEGSLVPQLSVAENIFAGRQPTTWLGQVDVREMRERARALIAQLGVGIDPALKVAALSPAQTQIVEIAKALSRDLRILILDEPTAALTLTETEKLFDIVRRLARDGVSVIYVSHRLAEIFALCHSVTVLKDGRLAGTRQVKQTSTDELIRLMVGREVHLARSERGHANGEFVLEAENVSAPPLVQAASITVRAGEIVCLAGLIGSGRSEFCEAVFGVRRRRGGTIRIGGRPIDPTGPWDAKRAGIGMVPEDRKTSGLFPGMDIVNNIAATVLSKVSSGVNFSEAKAEALARNFVDELRIATPSVRQVVDNLSGGNQQKVLLAKWLAMEPRLLIVDEPTRGVDVGARSEIYRLLQSACRQGRCPARRIVGPPRGAGAGRPHRRHGGRPHGRRIAGRRRHRGTGAGCHAVHRFDRRSQKRSRGSMSVAELPQTVAERSEERREGLLLRVVRRLANSRELTLFVLVVALAVVMSVVYPNNFPTAPNMRAVLLNLAPVGILVCGMMLLMIGGTFDLSVGSTLAFAGVWAGVVAGWWGWPPETAVLAGILVGALCGLVNGLIVTRIGINALIATLGTLTIYRSLTYVTAGPA